MTGCTPGRGSTVPSSLPLISGEGDQRGRCQTIRRRGQAGQSVTTRQTRAAWQNSTRVLLTHRLWDGSSGSSDMNDPQINVDHFYHRPVYHVVGLLTDKPEISAISRELGSAGVDVAAVEILCGERGAAILDEHGRYHGLRGRVVRAFQRLGYDGTTLALYDEALRDGDLLLQVPVRPADRYHITAALQRHQVHDVGYFGPGTFEQFPIPETD